MNKTIYLEPNQVPAVLRGNYSGKRFSVHVVDSVTVPAHAGLWSGGNRDVWDVIGIDGNRFRLSDGDAAWNGTQQEKKIALVSGMIVRRHSQGAYTDMTFYIHPETAVKLLPPPAPELTPQEREVLRATKSYKSSYGGRDRYQMSQDDRRYDDKVPQMTRAQWDEAKASLIAKNLLNKSGAITVAGRNAI